MREREVGQQGGEGSGELASLNAHLVFTIPASPS